MRRASAAIKRRRGCSNGGAAAVVTRKQGGRVALVGERARHDAVRILPPLTEKRRQLSTSSVVFPPSAAPLPNRDDDASQQDEETRRLANTLDETSLIQTLKSWRDPGQSSRASSSATRMHELLTQWLLVQQQQQRGQKLTGTDPFILVMKQYKDEAQNNGTAAMGCAQVLDKWGEMLGGNLELSPHLEAFHIVLEACTKNTPMDTGDAEGATTMSDLALDLLSFLEQSATEGNVSLTPKVETYARVIDVLFWHQHTSDNNSFSPSPTSTDMGQVMNRLIEKLEKVSQHRLTSKEMYHAILGYSKALGWVVRYRRDGTTQQQEEHHSFGVQDTARLLPESLGLRILGFLEALLVLAGDHGNDDDDDDNDAPSPRPSSSPVAAALAYSDEVRPLLGKAYKSALTCLLHHPAMDPTAKAQEGVAMIYRLEQLGEQFRSSVSSSLVSDQKEEEMSLLMLPWPEHYQTVTELICHLENLSNADDDSNGNSMMVELAQDLLERSERRHLKRHRHRSHVPLVLYERVIYVFSRASGAAPRAEALFYHVRSMLDQSAMYNNDETTTREHHPTTHRFSEAESALLTRMWTYVMMAYFHQRDDNDDQANDLFRNTASNTSASSSAAQKGFDIYLAFKDDPVMAPTPVTYAAVLKTLARISPSQPDMALREAIHVRNRMKRTEITLGPNHTASLITAWARSGARDAAPYAQELFEELHQAYQEASNRSGRPFRHQKDSMLKPQMGTYAALITAWARSHDPNRGERALHLLHHMKQHYYPVPDAVTFSAVIDALSKQSDNKRKGGGSAAAAQAKSRAAAAERILAEMEYLGRKHHYAKPNAVTYATVIAAWGRAGEPQRAQEVLERLERAYQEEVAAASATNPAAGKAVAEHLRPDHVCYSSVIYAWSKSNHGDAPRRAMAVFDRVRQSGTLQPNGAMYGGVLTALSRAQKQDQRAADAYANQAFQIFEGMKHDYFTNGNTLAKPNAQTYTIAMQAWSKSLDPDKATKVWNMYLELKHAYEKGDNEEMRPDMYTVVAVLNACTWTKGRHVTPHHRQEAARVALLMLTELKSCTYMSPSSVAYTNVLTALGYQLPEEDRERFGKVTFDQACQDGCVDKRVIKTLRNRFPTLYAKLPRDMDGEKVKIPPEWSYSVKSA